MPYPSALQPTAHAADRALAVLLLG
jgi:hypothetical protein